MYGIRLVVSVIGIAALLAGCANQRRETVLLKDNELALPADYKSWPKFLSNIQRADNKQVREIYINRPGTATARGAAFPNGTVFVMEIHKANPGADGRLEKGELAKIFVMGKNPGWGAAVSPAELRTGDWIYSAYKADGQTPSSDDIAQCRACHLPLAKQDFVHRYDEYFDQRGK